MANQKISAMAAASALTGTELLAGVQSGGNVKVTANQVGAFVGFSPYKLLSKVVTAASQASVLFDSSVIPTSGFSDLILSVKGQTNEAALNTPIKVQLNGDTGANYDWCQLIMQATAVNDTGGVFPDTSLTVGYINAQSGSAGYQGQMEANFGNFLGPYNKTVVWTGSFMGGTTASNCFIGSGNGAWHTVNAPITSMLVIAGSSTFKDGAIVELFARI